MNKIKKGFTLLEVLLVVGIYLGGRTAASIGTAGIMNRCQKLVLVDEKNAPAATHVPDKGHPLYAKLAEAKAYYWDIFREKVKLPAGMNLYKYSL